MPALILDPAALLPRPEAEGGFSMGLQADPHEKVNLAVNQPEHVKEISGLLNDWYPLEERQAGVLTSAKQSP
jgi:hypothetical protein